MKKILTAILVFVTVSLVSTVIGLPTYAAETTNMDQLLDINNTDLRYQNNLEYMNMRVTDPKKLELLLRPSKGSESDNEDIIALAKSLTASLTDDYSKVQAIHNWVCSNIYYDSDEYNAQFNPEFNTDLHTVALTYQSAATTLNTKKGMCGGYANLTCALLRAAGIPSQNYFGMAFDANSGGYHAWTGAYISNQKRWIVLDTTWDSSNKYHSGKYVTGGTKQKYFDPDLYTFSKDHLYTPLYKPYNPNTDFSFHGIKQISLGLNEKGQYNAGCPYPEAGTPEDTERLNHIWAGVEDESYVSSNPKVATVDQMGRVTGHAYGTTTISAALLDGSGLIASYVLTVEPQKLYTIYVPSSEMTLGDCFIAEAKTYKYTVKNEYTKWSSSDPNVATIDKDGKITAVGCGTADITATYTDDSLTSTATRKIYVNPIRTGVALSPKTLTVPLDSPSLIPLTVNDLSGNKLYGTLNEWTSSNPEVATVSSGYVRALKEGTTVITLRTHLSNTVNGKLVEGGEVSDTCIVTVVGTQDATPPVVKLPTINVTFDSQGGTAVNSMELKPDANGYCKIPTPVSPTRSGYTFTGWVVGSPDNSTVWDFKTWVFTYDDTLYAKWVKTNTVTSNSPEAAVVIPKVAIVSLDHVPFVEGDNNEFYISAKDYTGQVQYQLFYIQESAMKTWKLIDAPGMVNGWTKSVDAQEPITVSISHLALKADKYRFAIRVRRVGVKGLYANSYGDYDNAYPFNLSVDKSSTVALNGDMNIEETELTTGQNIVIKGVDGLPANTLYKLHLFDVRDNKWIIDDGAYSTNPTITKGTNGFHTGAYVLDLWVKTPNSTAKYDGWKLKTIHITEGIYNP